MKFSPKPLKNKIPTLVLILCFATTSAAQPLDVAIDAIQKTYQSFTDLSADFVQETNVVLLDKIVTRRGTIQLKKEGKLRIEYAAPERKHYISDGSTLWTYTPEDAASLMTFSVSNGAIPREALSFLNGFGKLRKEFQVTVSTAFTPVPTHHTALHLIPRSTKTQFTTLDALFNPEHQLVTLVIHNASGNRSTYRFTNIRPNTSLSDTLFTLGNVPKN